MNQLRKIFTTENPTSDYSRISLTKPNHTMKKITLLLKGVVLALILSTFTLKAQIFSDRLTFSSHLTPAPGVSTNANGVGAFMLTSAHDTMYFTISASNLTSGINGYHLHNARTGGNVVVDFDGKVNATTVRSFFTGSQLATLLPDFIAGNLYAAVHTVNNPAVEIFGFIKPESDWGYYAMLDGMQSGSGSTAVGHASVNFGLKGDTAIVRVATNGLTSKITGAHLHTGKLGQSGGVLIHFENLITADSMSLIGGVSITSSDWTALMTALMSDSIYLNIHTKNFAVGEIRGQLRTTNDLRFDTWFNQTNITATGLTVLKPSNAYGAVTLSLNSTMDTLHYNGVFTGLTSNLTGAHFHNALPTSNGSVVKDIDPSIIGNVIAGIWTKYDASNPLTANYISELLKGNIYMVIHTDSNPTTGEIRGNIMRLAREGLIAEIDGIQSGSGSAGLGTGVASYDRDRTNFHVMLSCNGLLGNVTACHIHFGMKGQAGPVALDLDPITNNGTEKFLKSADGFTDAVCIPIRTNDSSYINVHSSSFANGEIRGQLIRNYKISAQTHTTGIDETGIKNSIFKLYPNPVQNELTINFDSIIKGNASIVIYDLNGREVLSGQSYINTGNNNIKIETSSLNNGLYLVELKLNNETPIRMKLMKN